MNTELWRQAKNLFEAAIELPAEKRASYLADVCRDDAPLRSAVDTLLAADARVQPLLTEDAVPAVLEALEDQHDQQWQGRALGAYRILEKIGSGGMGTVFLADRHDAEFQKRVAIKVLPLWMSNEDNLRRFRQERQILALLEHPNIARLLDGGTTDEGLPYLVMEYVEGEPISTFCDRRRLNVASRLELMRKVCTAVDYAHRGLVVHRDLKANNILVTLEGEPKLLDFGIAKLLDGPGAAGAMAPTHGRFLTPGYASPEQLAGRPITTASDVYSLGVLLYLLLTGRLPFSWQGLTVMEIEQTLTNSRPVLPSQAVAGDPAGDRGDQVASERASRPAALRRLLSGDLDNIALKALLPDPERRYHSAAELGADLRRFQLGLPVKARPPSWSYRLGKLIRRHVVATAVAVTSSLLITGFGIVTYLQSLSLASQRDQAERQREKAEHVAQLLVESFELADPSKTRGEQITAREILDNGARRVSFELADQPELEATMLHTIGKVQTRLGLYDRARPLLEKALANRLELLGEDHPETAESLHEWALLLLSEGNLDEAEQAIERALTVRRTTDPEHVADSLHVLAEAKRAHGDRATAIALHEQAISLQRATVGEEHPDVVEGLTRLAHSVRLHGDHRRAEALYRQSLEIQQRLYSGDHPVTAEILNRLARLLSRLDDLEQAESLGRSALAMNRRLYGDEHPAVATCLDLLANLERKRGDFHAAEDLYLEALTLQRRLLGSEHPKLASQLYNLALLLHRDLDEHQRAEALYLEAIEIFDRALGSDHVNMGFFKLGLGGVLLDLGRPGEAEQVLRSTLALFSRLSRAGAGGRNAAMAKSELAGALIAREQFAEAEDLLSASYPVLVEHLGEDHPSSRRALRRLIRLLRATGRPQQAANLEALVPSS